MPLNGRAFNNRGFPFLKTDLKKLNIKHDFWIEWKHFRVISIPTVLKISSDKCSATTKCKAQSIWRAGLKRRIRRLKYLKPLPYVLSSWTCFRIVSGSFHIQKTLIFTPSPKLNSNHAKTLLSQLLGIHPRQQTPRHFIHRIHWWNRRSYGTSHEKWRQ